jgi:hypothetical protein
VLDEVMRKTATRKAFDGLNPKVLVNDGLD